MDSLFVLTLHSSLFNQWQKENNKTQFSTGNILLQNKVIKLSFIKTCSFSRNKCNLKMIVFLKSSLLVFL